MSDDKELASAVKSLEGTIAFFAIVFFFGACAGCFR